MHTKEARTKERWQKSRSYLFASLHCVWTRLLLITKTIQCASGPSLWMQAVQRKVRNVATPNLWLQLRLPPQSHLMQVIWVARLNRQSFSFFFIMLRFNWSLQSWNPSFSRFPTKSDLTVGRRGSGGLNFVSSFFLLTMCTSMNIRDLFLLF